MQMALFPDMPKHDPSEAPLGYYAVPKEIAKPKDGGNICRACDWRPECQKRETDFTAHNHRCMGYPIVSFGDGREISRRDGCSVVFKRLPPSVAASQPEGAGR